jgi:hypothetical protein
MNELKSKPHPVILAGGRPILVQAHKFSGPVWLGFHPSALIPTVPLDHSAVTAAHTAGIRTIGDESAEQIREHLERYWGARFELQEVVTAHNDAIGRIANTTRSYNHLCFSPYSYSGNEVFGRDIPYSIYVTINKLLASRFSDERAERLVAEKMSRSMYGTARNLILGAAVLLVNSEASEMTLTVRPNRSNMFDAATLAPVSTTVINGFYWSPELYPLASTMRSAVQYKLGIPAKNLADVSFEAAYTQISTYGTAITGVMHTDLRASAIRNQFSSAAATSEVYALTLPASVDMARRLLSGGATYADCIERPSGFGGPSGQDPLPPVAPWTAPSLAQYFGVSLEELGLAVDNNFSAARNPGLPDGGLR